MSGYLSDNREKKPGQWQAHGYVEEVGSKRGGDCHISLTCSCDNAGDDQVWDAAAGGDECDTQSALGEACDLADNGGPPDHAVCENRHPDDAHHEGKGIETTPARLCNGGNSELKMMFFSSNKVKNGPKRPYNGPKRAKNA